MVASRTAESVAKPGGSNDSDKGCWVAITPNPGPFKLFADNRLEKGKPLLEEC